MDFQGSGKCTELRQGASGRVRVRMLDLVIPPRSLWSLWVCVKRSLLTNQFAKAQSAILATFLRRFLYRIHTSDIQLLQVTDRALRGISLREAPDEHRAANVLILWLGVPIVGDAFAALSMPRNIQ